MPPVCAGGPAGTSPADLNHHHDHHHDHDHDGEDDDNVDDDDDDDFQFIDRLVHQASSQARRHLDLRLRRLLQVLPDHHHIYHQYDDDDDAVEDEEKKNVMKIMILKKNINIITAEFVST